jgi:inhibitor of cysteine peptidase
MKVKTGLLSALVLSAVFLFGCTPTPEPASLEVSCDDFTSQNHITRQATIKAGEEFTVTLCSNQTTGFAWSETAQISDQTVVKQTSHQYVAPGEGGETQLVGAAGEEVWKFQALKSGSSTISLEYSRPWEGGEKGAWTFSLEVTVN